jgi:hypothetical protein
VAAELVGVLLFSLYGSTAPADVAAWANGFSLAVLSARCSACKAQHSFGDGQIVFLEASLQKEILAEAAGGSTEPLPSEANFFAADL